MRYCGTCGTLLDTAALAAGRCPSCGVAVEASSTGGDPATTGEPSAIQYFARESGATPPPSVAAALDTPTLHTSAPSPSPEPVQSPAPAAAPLEPAAGFWPIHGNDTLSGGSTGRGRGLAAIAVVVAFLALAVAVLGSLGAFNRPGGALGQGTLSPTQPAGASTVTSAVTALPTATGSPKPGATPTPQATADSSPGAIQTPGPTPMPSTPPGPVITISPVHCGPLPGTASFTIANSGVGTLNWMVVAAPAPQTYIVSPSSGSEDAGKPPDPVQVTILVGHPTITITSNAPNGTEYVTVNCP